MIFRYGQKIHDKIMALLKPEFEGDPEVDVFDLWKGCNFRLRVKNVAGYPNYDDSSFESQTALSDDDSQLEKIWNSEHSLQELVAENKFKTESELKRRLNMVLGVGGKTSSESVSQEDEEDILQELENAYSKNSSESDDDDPLAKFRDLIS